MLQEHPKICKECRHFSDVRCTAGSTVQLDVVTGFTRRESVDCYYMRGPNGRCGPDGKLWERREPPSIPKPRDNGWRSGSTGDADWSR